jgi:hydroxymethylpyrimidine kinase/phosphomethylpyrimidine kinase
MDAMLYSRASNNSFCLTQMMKKVLSIAGSDPSGGAGIQVDLKTFQALGAFGMAVPAAFTAQNSKGVVATHPVDPVIIAGQLDALLSDIKPDAIKTGMLLTSNAVHTVASAVKKYRITNLVVDPVILSSSGVRMLEYKAMRTLIKELLPLTLIVTPNISEAEYLSGIGLECDEDMDYAAGKIMDFGPQYVLIKGGHRKGPATDTLYGGKTVFSFSTPRRKGEFHGTGCVLSAAITVFIARGLPVEKAVEKAKQVVDGLLRTAKPVGKGTTKYFQF